MDSMWPTSGELRAAKVLQSAAGSALSRRRVARKRIHGAVAAWWSARARRREIERRVLQARMAQALRRTSEPAPSLKKREKRDKYGSTCVFRVRSRGITNVIGTKRDLVLVMYPLKHTVRNLMCDIYRAVRVPFVAELNGRRLAVSDKKLYRINAFAGGVFIINVTEIQSHGTGSERA